MEFLLANAMSLINASLSSPGSQSDLAELASNPHFSVSYHSSPAGNDGVELPIRHLLGCSELVRATAQVVGEPQPPFCYFQGQEFCPLSGLVVVVIQQQGVALYSGKLDIDVIIVGIHTGELHIGQLFKPITVQLAVIPKNTCKMKSKIWNWRVFSSPCILPGAKYGCALDMAVMHRLLKEPLV